MKTPAALSADFPENTLQTVARSWGRFWFRPADPTLLGLIRICAGLIVLYVHIAYSFDLQDFFGKDAWLNYSLIQEYRREAPWYPEAPSWNEVPEWPRPTSPEEEREIKEFMLRWDGMNPKQAFSQGYYFWSIWFHVTDPAWMRVVHGGVLVILLLFTIGFCTRITSVLAWLATLSYIQRAPTSLFGMDTIMVFVLLYLMIGPSGAALSVDRLIVRYWATWRALRARGSSRKSAGFQPGSLFKKGDGLEFEPPVPRVSANLALRMLQIHVCIVYFISGISKLQGNAWWTGTAIWGTMANPEFSPLHSALFADLLRFLCQHRFLWELCMTGGVLFTLVFEIGFPFMVWNRWLRWLMVAAAVLMHTGIALMMGLVTFSLIMIVAVMSFIPLGVVPALLRMLGSGPEGYRLEVHNRNRVQVRAASLIHACDFCNQIKLIDHPSGQHMSHSSGTLLSGSRPADSANWPTADADTDQVLQLTTPEGEILTGYPLCERVLRALHFCWPLALFTWIPGFSHVAFTLFPGSGSQNDLLRKDKGTASVRS